MTPFGSGLTIEGVVEGWDDGSCGWTAPSVRPVASLRGAGEGAAKPTAELMQALASGLDNVLGNTADDKRTGFVLLLFPLGAPEGARTNYVSNGERADVLTALKEIVARFEGRHHTGGRA